MNITSLKTTNWSNRSLYLNLGLILAICLGIWLPLPFPVRLVVATLLLFFLPGWLLLQALDFRADDGLEQATLAVGVSYALTTLGSLGALYLTGYLSRPLIVVTIGLISVISLIIGQFRAALTRYSLSPAPPLASLLYFFIPVALAAFFGFTNLDYAGYWGDEMNGLLRALSLTGGAWQTIFEHTKGPVEILLPAALGLLVERFEPFSLRFPFALAYVAGVAGHYLLARRLFNQPVALLAALIIALNGLYISFGRMVQYQPVVFLTTGLALLLVYDFYRHGRGVDLHLGLFLAGLGLLAHYDMLLTLPPLAYLIWQRYGWRRPAWRAERRRWIGAGGLLLLVLVIFYAPFSLHPNAGDTTAYLNRRIVTEAGWPVNNFDELYMFTIMYNSSYYIVFIALLGLTMIGGHLKELFQGRYQDRRLWLVPGGVGVISLLAILTGYAYLVPLLLCVLLLGLLVGFSPLSIELKLIYVWLGVSFIGYIFLVDHPRTHLRMMYPGWSVLAALALYGLLSKIQLNQVRPPSNVSSQNNVGASLALTPPALAPLTLTPRRLTMAVVMMILILLFWLSAYYVYLLFVDIQKEYILTYPDHKSWLYWEDAAFPFGSRRLYGAPHRLGWQMIHHLYAQGKLQGDWDSNDEGSNLFWYTLGWPRNPCYPRYYFLTQFEQREDSDRATLDLAQAGYVPVGQIWNRERRQMDIYEFAPLGYPGELERWPEPAHYDSFVVPADFQSLPHEVIEPQIPRLLPNPAAFRPSPQALQQIADHYGDPRIVNVRDKVALLGYDLDETWAKPGGVIMLTLYWQALEVVNLPYKIFTHLESDPAATGSTQLWTQADDFPACGSQSTRHWTVGQAAADRHALRLPPDLPAGEYIIRVGLYEPQTGLRMDLLDILENPQGISFELVKVMVHSP